MFSTPNVQATINNPSPYKAPAPSYPNSHPKLASFPIAIQPSPDNKLSPMGITTYDIENRNNATNYINPQDNSGNVFGDGSLSENPIEPGTTPPVESENTPIGDIPWGVITALMGIYILVKQTRSHQLPE